jgi:uncharacterized protein (TIGR02996 family)
MLRPMSGSRQALFQAVLDRPDEDAPRLLFAAFLDAQGDPYGAFIRAQLAHTEALRHRSDEEAKQRYDEVLRLENEHRTSAWTNGIEELVRLPAFIRGFVEKVVINAKDYLSRADELYRVAPIRHLVLSEVGDLVIDVARDPHLAQLVSLTLGNTSRKNPIGDAGIAAIAASPYLRKLKSLEAARQDIGMEGLEALCASKELPALIYTNLVSNRFENPEEGYGTDWATGRPDLNGAYLPPLGKQLEAKFGYLPWLHAPSQLRHFPPLDDEL